MGPMNNQLRVGAFVIVGVITVLGTILMLGGGKMLFTKHATLYAHLSQVQGLAEGSIVSLAGVTIGNITKINFSSDNKTLIVTMKIDSQFLPKIPETASAEVRTQGALGDKYVYINVTDSSGDPIKEGGIITASKNSDLMGVISEKGGEAVKIFDIISELHKLVLTINSQGRTDKIMTNLAEASASLKATSQEAQQLIKELRMGNPEKIHSAIAHLDSVMSKIDRGQGTLGALVNDPTLHEQLKAFMGGNNRRQPLQNLIRTSIEKPQ